MNLFKTNLSLKILGLLLCVGLISVFARPAFIEAKTEFYSIEILPKDSSLFKKSGLPILQVKKISLGVFSDSSTAVQFAQLIYPKFTGITKVNKSKDYGIIRTIKSVIIPYSKATIDWEFFPQISKIAAYQTNYNAVSNIGDLYLIDTLGIKKHENVLQYQFKNNRIEYEQVKTAYSNYEGPAFSDNIDAIQKLSQQNQRSIKDIQNSLITVPYGEYSVFLRAKPNHINKSTPVSWDIPLGSQSSKGLTQKYSSLKTNQIHLLAFEDEIEMQTTLILIRY